MDSRNGLLIVQDGSKFFTALQLACQENGREYNHILIISGPFSSYEEADQKREK